MATSRVLVNLFLTAAIGLGLGASTGEARDRCARRVAFRRRPLPHPATPPRALWPRPREQRGGADAAIPDIEGPVTGGSRGGPTISATSFDLAAVGYRQQEFFI